MQINQTLLPIFAAIGIVPSLALVAEAAPSEAALQACRTQVEKAFPQANIELTPGLELLNSIFTIQWQTETGIEGFCRVTQAGEVLEFTNPYAVPEGQRPIESLAAFQTDRYEVRIFRLLDRLHMNIYNKATRRLELNRVLIAAAEAETGTTYTNLLGWTKYEATISPTGEYRLTIQSSNRTLYDAEGIELTPGQEVTLY